MVSAVSVAPSARGGGGIDSAVGPGWRAVSVPTSARGGGGIDSDLLLCWGHEYRDGTTSAPRYDDLDGTKSAAVRRARRYDERGGSTWSSSCCTRAVSHALNLFWWDPQKGKYGVGGIGSAVGPWWRRYR